MFTIVLSVEAGTKEIEVMVHVLKEFIGKQIIYTCHEYGSLWLTTRCRNVVLPVFLHFPLRISHKISRIV